MKKVVRKMRKTTRLLFSPTSFFSHYHSFPHDSVVTGPEVLMNEKSKPIHQLVSVFLLVKLNFYYIFTIYQEGGDRRSASLSVHQGWNHVFFPIQPTVNQNVKKSFENYL